MKKIIFTKFSNERAPGLAIRTDIIQDGDLRYVQKTPVDQQGTQHVQNIHRWFGKLSQQYKDTKIKFNACELTEHGIQVEYLTGETLEEELDHMLYEDRIEELTGVLGRYLDMVREKNGTEDFVITEEFRRVFGEAELPDGLKCGTISDIDMILSNVVVEDDSWTLIDYEWTFDFPVPVNYLLYRIIYNYVETSTARSRVRAMDLYTQAGLSQQEMQTYGQMEQHFQQYILGNVVPLRDMYWEISKGYINVHETIAAEHELIRKNGLQIYPDRGAGYDEAKSIFAEVKNGDEDHIRTAQIPLEGVESMRVDPRGTACQAGKVQFTNSLTGKQYAFTSNALYERDGWYYFETDDPMFLIRDLKEEKGALCVSMEVYEIDPSHLVPLRDYPATLQHYKNMVEAKEQEIQLMKGTKVWKMYEKIKGKKE